MFIFLAQYRIALFAFVIPVHVLNFKPFVLVLSFLLFFYFAAHSFSEFFALGVSKA
jgi:hypothetical protein